MYLFQIFRKFFVTYFDVVEYLCTSGRDDLDEDVRESLETQLAALLRGLGDVSKLGKAANLMYQQEVVAFWKTLAGRAKTYEAGYMKLSSK